MHCDDATLGSIPKTQISARLALWRPNKTDLEEARGPSAARGTSAYPEGHTYILDHKAGAARITQAVTRRGMIMYSIIRRGKGDH